MSEAEKEDIIRILLQTKAHLEPIAAKRIAEIQLNYDSIVAQISRIEFPDLRADLMREATRFLGYTSEHQAPIDAVNKALHYVEQTSAADLTRERVKAVAEESNWLTLINF